MKHGMGLGLILAYTATSFAADPPPRVAPTTATRPTAARILDLRIRHIRNYMMPAEYRAAVEAPDPEKGVVVVEGARAAPPLKSSQPIPSGFPPATLWWALRNPARSWRIILPDLNAPAAGPTTDKVPPPVFRWGP